MRTAPFCLLTALIFIPVDATAAQPIKGMIEVKLDGRWVEGQPLNWNASRVYLLGRDGRLWQFAHHEATDFRKTADRFRPETTSRLRANLLRELGDGFQVTGTNHYMIAHRRGEGKQWSPRFEQLYRSFVHYFSVRGFKLKKPAFPMLAIVYRDRDEFNHRSALDGATAVGNIAGYYRPISNRIALYDMREQGGQAVKSWQSTSSVIIHEATHQIAFNTGIHNRFTHPPLWVVEGLATMFEAPGVHDSRNHPNRRQRINKDRLADFRKLALADNRAEILGDIVASDRIFSADSRAAYAEAWALTFYLAETQPSKYAKYLAKTAARPPFTEYTESQRLADFTAVFGDNWPMLNSRMLSFLAEL